MFNLIQQHKQHYKQQHENYKKKHQNMIEDSSQESLHNDITKMHLLPPHCNMTPHSYTDFFNDSSKLHGVSPYQLYVEKHKKDGKPFTKLQYNKFYSDFKTDSLKYNAPRMAEFNNNSNIQNISQIKNENMKLYEETKNQKGFAVPMKSNGTNKIVDIYNDCINKPTFEYKRFGYDMLTHKNGTNRSSYTNHLVDNPLFNNDISEETNNLYVDYMNSRDKNASNLYETIFEDMYILGYNPQENNEKK